MTRLTSKIFSINTLLAASLVNFL